MPSSRMAAIASGSSSRCCFVARAGDLEPVPRQVAEEAPRPFESGHGFPLSTEEAPFGLIIARLDLQRVLILFGLNCLVVGATFRIETTEQLLQGLGVGAVPKEGRVGPWPNPRS